MKKFDQKFFEGMKEKLDVELIGIVSVETSPSEELKKRATSLLPGVKSVVVLGKETFKEVVALLRPAKGEGEAEPGELFGPHSEFINGRLNRAVHDLAILFRKSGYKSLPLPAARGFMTDQRFLTHMLSYKHAAQLAGLGTIGRHSLLITPEFGPRARLVCILTEAPIEASPVSEKDYCLNCDACIRECPAQALQLPKPGEAYSMNKFACRCYRQAGLICSVCVRACDEILG